MYCYSPYPEPCSRPPLTHTFARDSCNPQASLLWGHCFFLLGPGAQGSVCALQESFPQSYVSSGSSVVGLMATSSKRTYAISTPRGPVPAADHGQPIPPQEILKHSSVSVSVGSLGPGARQICLSPLSVSGENGV